MRTNRFAVAYVVLSAVVLSLAACGEPDVSPRPGFVDNREVSPDFAGSWSGTAALYVGTESQGSRPVNVEVQVEVHGPTLDVTISPVCGSSSMAMRADGNGRTTMWYGDVTCSAATDACPTLSIQYRSAVLKVLEDGRFYSLLNGTATGCGSVMDAQVEVYATRR